LVVPERDALIALNLLPLTPVELSRLLARFPCAADALEAVGSGAVTARDLALRPPRRPLEPCADAVLGDPSGSVPQPPRNEVPLDGGAARRLGAAGLLELADHESRKAAREGIVLATPREAAYPQALREISDPPPVIYISGTLEPADEVRLAIVGSRRASAYGLAVAPLLAGDLVRRGLTIVSGLARGIDAGAHLGALDAGGRTIAVLGSGLGQIYPREHRALARRINAQGGAVLSEYPLAMPPLSHCFPRRNRVISGLCTGIVVVEAAKASGALGTARLALEQGREVWAVPGPVTHATSVGTNGLLRAGAAHLACVAQDVLDELPAPCRVRLGLPESADDDSAEMRRAAHGRPLGAPMPVSLARVRAGTPTAGLDPETQGVLRHLRSGESLSIDELVSRCGLPIPRALAALSILEIHGLAVALPGDRIARARGRLV